MLPPIASELSWSRGALPSLIHPRKIRTEYLRQQGDEDGARANDQLVREHNAHSTVNVHLPANGPSRAAARPITNAERWLDPEAFSPAWVARNAAMLALFEERLARTAGTRFAEYGCGPDAPFASLAASAGYPETLCYDLKQWPIGNRLLDLNCTPFIVEPVLVGVLSGVIEYLDDTRGTLACLSAAHTYLLFSYTIAPNKASHTDVFHVTALHERCAVHGWRNHFDLAELIRLTGEFGYLEAICMHGPQIIALLRVYNARKNLD